MAQDCSQFLNRF